MQTYYIITTKENDMWPDPKPHFRIMDRKVIAARVFAKKQAWLKKLAGRKF